MPPKRITRRTKRCQHGGAVFTRKNAEKVYRWARKANDFLRRHRVLSRGSNLILRSGLSSHPNLKTFNSKAEQYGYGLKLAGSGLRVAGAGRRRRTIRRRY